jgi:hypothetical protein
MSDAEEQLRKTLTALGQMSLVKDELGVMTMQVEKRRQLLADGWAALAKERGEIIDAPKITSKYGEMMFWTLNFSWALIFCTPTLFWNNPYCYIVSIELLIAGFTFGYLFNQQDRLFPRRWP